MTKTQRLESIQNHLGALIAGAFQPSPSGWLWSYGFWRRHAPKPREPDLARRYPVDMRLGFDGLTAKVHGVLAADPFYGHAFVFRNKRGNRSEE